MDDINESAAINPDKYFRYIIYCWTLLSTALTLTLVRLFYCYWILKFKLYLDLFIPFFKRITILITNQRHKVSKVKSWARVFTVQKGQDWAQMVREQLPTLSLCTGDPSACPPVMTWCCHMWWDRFLSFWNHTCFPRRGWTALDINSCKTLVQLQESETAVIQIKLFFPMLKEHSR